MDEFGTDSLDDEALLELMRKRREEAALRDQSISSNNDLGRIIAGAAGGLEAAMTGGSGSEGAMRGMNFVAGNQQRLAALQSDKDSKEMANLTAIARIRADKQRRAQQSQDTLEKMREEYGLRTKMEQELGPMKDAREMARMAALTGDKRMALQAQERMKQAELGQRGEQFGATLEQKQAELAQRAQDAEALRNLQMEVAKMRESGATGRAEIGAGARLRGAEIGAAAKSAPKAGDAGSGGGKMLPPDKVILVNEGKAIPANLEDIKDTIEQNSDIFGPVLGRISAANPYDEKAQTIESQMRAASQAYGRFEEGGVLRKEDEDKYRKMFPQLSDTPQVAKNKLAIVDRKLKMKLSSTIDALKKSGYDVSGLAGGVSAAPAVPGVIRGGGKSKSLPKERVIGGKRFILMPSGKYQEEIL